MNVPITLYLKMTNWQAGYPSEEQALNYLWLPTDGSWWVSNLGGREPVLVAYPRAEGWMLEWYSAKRVGPACAGGLPVLQASVHGPEKLRLHQGAVIRDPNGEPYHPGWVPVVWWDARQNRWSEADEQRWPYWCPEAPRDE